VPSAEVPQGLPDNIPWESDATVLQNFTAKDSATGKTQSTRVYVSSKTLDANFTIYQKYLQDNGWTVNSTVNQPAVKNLSATKSGARLDITIAKNAQGQVSVNVSYLD
jgi:galactitol-specific phosphotransferase system IIB component